MQLTIQTLDSAPADSRPILQAIAADLGLVPNLAATAATSPALLAGFDGLRRAVGSTKLDPVLREVAGLAVGVAVDNHYGVAFHSTVLAGLGLDDADIERIRAGRVPADPKRAATPRSPARSRSDAGRPTPPSGARRPPARAGRRSSRSSRKVPWPVSSAYSTTSPATSAGRVPRSAGLELAVRRFVSQPCVVAGCRIRPERKLTWISPPPRRS